MVIVRRRGSRRAAAGDGAPLRSSFVGACAQRLRRERYDKPGAGRPPSEARRLARLLRPLTQAANPSGSGGVYLARAGQRARRSHHRFGFAYDERDGTGPTPPGPDVDRAGPAGLRLPALRKPPRLQSAPVSRRNGQAGPGAGEDDPRASGPELRAGPGGSGGAARPGSGRSSAGCIGSSAGPIGSTGRRALRRVGVLPLLGAGDRIRRPRRLVRLPLPRPGPASSATAQRWRSTSASGTTPTTSSWPSPGAISRSRSANARASPAKASTG